MGSRRRKAEAFSAKELTQLLASYARQSLWRSAAVLLEVQEVKDLPFLGAALAVLEKGRQWAAACQLLEDFQLRRLFPDGGALASVLMACGRAEHWPAVCQLLERVRWDELKTADWPRVTTAAITAFGFGRWSRAHWALEKLRATGLEGLKLSAAPVNAAMRCAPERMGSFWQRVLVCAEELNLRGPCPDQITLNTAVQACASASAWEAAVAAFKASALAVRPDAVSLNTAISACARAREWQRSLGLLLEGSVAPTVVSFNAAMRACELWQVALQLLELIPEHRLQPDVVSCNAALDACRGAWGQALALLSRMGPGSHFPRPDLVSFNTALAAVADSNELNDWERSIALLQALREEQLLPDLISFNAALHTCTGAARWEEALGLVQELRMEALRPDIYSVTGACSVCSHAGQWQRALALAEEARKGRLHPDALLFSTLLFACEKGSQWELAVEIMADMRRSEVALDALGCGIAIRACAAKGSWDLALWVLAGCEKPGPQAFLAAVDAVEASGAPATPELFEELCRKAASSAVF